MSESKYSAMPQVDFMTFIMSMNASALMNLGAIPDPVSGKSVKNVTMAKQTIDILGIIQEKTRGNLTDEEVKLLENVLHDLHLMYVKESN